MKISDLLAMCVRNLTRRKFRTFLTVSGVVIGTCAIVVMISLGVGISASTEEMLASVGDLTMITVYNQGADNPITDDSVSAIQAMPGVMIASPTMRFNPSGGMQLISGRKGRYSTYPNLSGVLPEALEALGYKTQAGTLELGSDGKVYNLVFGSMIPYQFEDTKKRWPNNRIEFDIWSMQEGGGEAQAPDPFFDPMEAEYTLVLPAAKDGAKDLEYKINLSGILEFSEQDWEPLYSVYISIDDLKEIKAKYEKENAIKRDKDYVESYEQLKVKCDHVDNVGEVQQAIREMGLYPQSMQEARESIQKSTQQTQLILGALGAVSLFVAMISITNTMIMSVYERTREIGVMKVLGCLVGNIRTIFLLEAGVIGLFGGIVGVGVSYLLSFLFNTYGGSIGDSLFGMGGMLGEDATLSIIPPWLVLLGLTVATSIGLLAGFYPANRAVRISALEAIKQE